MHLCSHLSHLKTSPKPTRNAQAENLKSSSTGGTKTSQPAPSVPVKSITEPTKQTNVVDDYRKPAPEVNGYINIFIW